MNPWTRNRIRVPVALLSLALTGEKGLLAQDSRCSEPPAHCAVQALVAESWGVEWERVLLDWGSNSVEGLPTVFSGAGLVGRGRQGHLVVSFQENLGSHRANQVVVRAGVAVMVPVAGRSLPRGASLGPDDILLESSVHWGEPGQSDAQVHEGWITQRPIRKGEVLSRPAVAPPRAVVSGMPVTIIVRRGGIVLTLAGTAAGHAELGGSVHVRTENGQRLTGVAVGPSQVEIPNASSEGNP
jgi:flagella basal body P-ring formation protein FlgA